MLRFVLFAVLAVVHCQAASKPGIALSFKEGERVQILANKVGPFFNPSETYDYYELPVCRPATIVRITETLGEVLTGDRLSHSLFEINFREDFESKRLCQLHLEGKYTDRLHEAIEDYYYFEFVVDGLEVFNFIGDLEEVNLPFHHHRFFLFVHFHFDFLYNPDGHIIATNVTMASKPPHDISRRDNIYDIDITYSAHWRPTSVPVGKRLSVHGDSFFPKAMEIHWMNIVNSVLLVVLLTALVLLILSRVLSSDIMRYSREDEELDSVDDYGWKQVHGDVFRFPPLKNLFCAIVGVGFQFVILVCIVLLFSLFGFFSPHNHGSMLSALIIFYAMSSGFAGFVSGRLFRQMGGTNWVYNILLTASLFALPFFGVWSTINTVAWYYNATQALPWTTVLVVMLIWLCVGFPLTILGGILGKNSKAQFDAPTRTKNIPREIPVVPWFMSSPIQMLVGGFLPFSAISVELYYVFSSLWGRESYTLFGILLLVFAIVLLVAACITVTLTYFQLSTEDYRWWWQSILNAGATGAFVFAYATFFFHYRSNMSGVFQTVQFFGYTSIICYVFFLILGSIGFFSSLSFVKHLFKQLKTD